MKDIPKKRGLFGENSNIPFVGSTEQVVHFNGTMGTTLDEFLKHLSFLQDSLYGIFGGWDGKHGEIHTNALDVENSDGESPFGNHYILHVFPAACEDFNNSEGFILSTTGETETPKNGERQLAITPSGIFMRVSSNNQWLASQWKPIGGGMTEDDKWKLDTLNLNGVWSVPSGLELSNLYVASDNTNTVGLLVDNGEGHAEGKTDDCYQAILTSKGVFVRKGDEEYGWQQEWHTQPCNHGSTSNRPSNPLVGECYFDETLHKPIWYGGSGNWYDASGTVV